MGRVWAATHTVTRRPVAMKFLKEDYLDNADVRKRFLREASAASALRHPHVVEVLDAFECEDTCPVMVMERLEGETLGQRLARDERLSVEETAALMMPVVSAVGAAHAMGIVHRDIKPENIHLARSDGRICVKVLDFGIAKIVWEPYEDAGRSNLVTSAGAMLGTPCYMAPEQASGEGIIDHRVDVWSIGVILYECLSGMRPIEGENLAQVMTRLMSAGIIPLDRLAPELPQDVASLVSRMLCREVNRRPRDLTEVSDVLSRHSHVSVPSFGLPNSMQPFPDQAAHSVALETPPSVAPPVTSPSAATAAASTPDTEATTLLSSPPVVRGKATTVRWSARPRAWLLASGGIALVLGGGALTLRQSPGVEPAPELAASPAEARDRPELALVTVGAGAATVPTTTPSASVGGAPTAGGRVSEPARDGIRAPASSAAARIATSTTKVPPSKARSRRAAPRRPPPTSPTSPPTKGSKDESVLFSGRK